MRWRCEACGCSGGTTFKRCNKCGSITCKNCALGTGWSKSKREDEAPTGFWHGVLGSVSRGLNGACANCNSLDVHDVG
jgi:hypothetical protein